MADIQSAYAKSVDAFNEVATVAAQPTLTALGAQIITLQGDKTALQSQLDAANASVTQLSADKQAMQTAINAAVAKAQADKDADNANVAGQGVLDALAKFAGN